MLKIRLRRMGARNAPFYRVVVSDSRRTPKASPVEEVGYYNPRRKPAEVVFDRQRIDHWVSNGALLSPTVKRLLDGPPKVKAKPAEKAAAPATPEPEAAPAAAASAEPAAETEAAAESEAAASAESSTAAEPAAEAAPAEAGESAGAEPEKAGEGDDETKAEA